MQTVQDKIIAEKIFQQIVTEEPSLTVSGRAVVLRNRTARAERERRGQTFECSARNKIFRVPSSFRPRPSGGRFYRTDRRKVRWQLPSRVPPELPPIKIAPYPR